jgi:hypothetical protein
MAPKQGFQKSHSRHNQQKTSKTSKPFFTGFTGSFIQCDFQKAKTSKTSKPVNLLPFKEKEKKKINIEPIEKPIKSL